MKIYMLNELQISELCKEIAERVAKNAGVAPQLCYSPVKFAIDDLVKALPDEKVAAVVPDRHVIASMARMHNVFVPTGLAKAHFPGEKIQTELKIAPLQDLVQDVVTRVIDEITRAAA